MLVEAVCVIHCCEMLHCKDLLMVIITWQSQLTDYWHVHGQHALVKFFEVDIIARFPSLDRDAVWQNVQHLFTMVQEARRRRPRVRAGQQMRFTINEIDHKLDLVGGGDTELYHNITQAQVLNFVYCLLLLLYTCRSSSAHSDL